MIDLFECPKVALISRPIMEIDGTETFLQSHGVEWPALQAKLDNGLDMGDLDGEYLIEMAGRTCYMSFGKGRTHKEHLQHLVQVGHGSVLEHANYGLLVWNVSRSLTHELVRHRAGFAYSQLSQRYVDESDTGFVVPPAIQALQKRNPLVFERWVQHMQDSRSLYADLTAEVAEMYADLADKTERRKKARQAARSVLPNATETKIFITANARALRHFIEMRANPAADVEIRCLAVEIFKIMQQAAPLAFHGMKIVDLPDQTQGVESEYRKV